MDTRDNLGAKLIQQAKQVLEKEPELCSLLHSTVLAPWVETFADAVASTVGYRLLLKPCTNMETTGIYCPHSLKNLLRDAISSDDLEWGHTMADAIVQDALAVVDRDPAMDSLLEVILFSKGYAALVCHRAAARVYCSKKFTALFLQSQASAVFAVDIHPKAQIGMGCMLDHGTGIVIGETAVVGNNCTLLHGVTLGGTGKQHGDRHPKVGNNVLIGAGSSILGNVRIGNGCKIGAGSVVLRSIPDGATAVGAPAKIVGKSTDTSGSEVDELLEHVQFLHKSTSLTDTASIMTTEDDEQQPHEPKHSSAVCPWRAYAEMAKDAPPGSITICSLKKMLHGCTMTEIGNSFFALDQHNVGYIKAQVFAERAPTVIPEYTHLDTAAVRDLIAPFLEKQAVSISASSFVTR